MGTPVGSLLLGDESFIKQARRIRKVFGGAMRQAGYIAAAGIYALDNNVARLKEDHEKAKQINEILTHCSFVKEVLPVETNIVVFKLIDSIKDSDFISTLETKGVHVVGFGPQTIRMVTHLDFTSEMLNELRIVLKSI